MTLESVQKAHRRIAPHLHRTPVLSSALLDGQTGARLFFKAENLQKVEETSATLVHPYDDDHIIAGQGTAALEFLEQTPGLEILMTPIGGGGLISGTAIVAKGCRQDLQVIGAEPALADDAFRSWKAGELLPPDSMDTIADGLRAGLGERNFGYLHELVDDVLLVSEEAIVRTTKLLMHYLKTVVEPSAAVPMAAILEHPNKFVGKRVGIILSGGNLDLDAPPWLRSQ